MAEQELESKLRKVKAGVYDALAAGEVVSSAYFGIVYNLLLEEGFFGKAKYFKSTSLVERNELVSRVGAGLEHRLGLVKSWGLLCEYVGRKDVPLSEGARKDLEDFDTLKESTKAYIKSHTDSGISDDEFHAKIREHLSGYQWPFAPSDKKLNETVARLGVVLSHEMGFMLKKPVETICGYDKEMFERVLYKI